MENNFDLKKFLKENKLTKPSKQAVKENVNYEVTLDGKTVNLGSIELGGVDSGDAPDFADAYIEYAEFEDGTELTERELDRLAAENYGLVYDLVMNHFNENKNPKSKLEQIVQAAWAEKDLNKAKKMVVNLLAGSRVKSKDQMIQTIQNIMTKPRFDSYLANSLLKFEKLGLSENKKIEKPKQVKLSKREAYLTRLVENALGLPQTSPQLEEEEMVAAPTMPKYENIEKLMQEIERGTNEAAYKHKMAKMKEYAEMLEARVSTLEEGDGAEFVDAKKVKQMKKDIMSLRKHAEKLEREYDKKFGEKKTKKEVTTEQKNVKSSRLVALRENRFYAPNYIKQKYGKEAKEIEQNIFDAEEAENNPNLWDLFTSLETPREVEDFVKGYRAVNETSRVRENQGSMNRPRKVYYVVNRAGKNEITSLKATGMEGAGKDEWETVDGFKSNIILDYKMLDGVGRVVVYSSTTPEEMLRELETIDDQMYENKIVNK